MCGRNLDFPEVELHTKTKWFKDVGGKKVRRLTSTCPPGQQLKTHTCDKTSNSFGFREEGTNNGFTFLPFATTLACKFKNDAIFKRSTSIVNKMICGDPSKLEVDVLDLVPVSSDSCALHSERFTEA